MDPPVMDCGPRTPGAMGSGVRHTVHLIRRQSVPMYGKVGALGRGGYAVGGRVSRPPAFTGNSVDEDSSSLVSALKSLESTIQKHCQLLNACKPKRDKLGANKSGGDGKSLGMGMPPGVAPPPQPSSQVDISSRQNSSSSLYEQGNALKDLLGIRESVTVYIRVVFLKIGEIDTLKENFMADAFIQARWREPLLDGHTEVNSEDIDFDAYWNPKIYVENNLGEPKESIWMTVTFSAIGEATVYERRRIKGCFLENLELDEFPFDTQDLTLTITSERSEAELDLLEDSSEISSINVQSFVDEQEWKLHSHVETWKRVTTRIYHNSKYKHAAISTSCRASRRPGFFIWNIFLVMLFICSLAFATYTVSLDLPQNRLQLSFILLLTTITFKFVVSQTLPRISYLTYLDKYILTSMGILCAVCVWHAVVPHIENRFGKTGAEIADMAALAILGGLYFMFHIVFFLYIYFVALQKRWKYTEKDREHKEKMRTLQDDEEPSWTNTRRQPI